MQTTKSPLDSTPLSRFTGTVFTMLLRMISTVYPTVEIADDRHLTRRVEPSPGPRR
jgi:hypothetical protein